MEFLALLVVIAVIIMIQNLVYKKMGFSNVDYKCYFSTDEAYEGDEVELIEEVTNAKWLPLPWLKSDLTTSRWLELGELQSTVTDKSRFVTSFFMLKSYHKIKRKWKVKCLRRGVFQIDKITLVATDLLGNLNISKAASSTSTLTVLPNTLALDELSISSCHLTGDTFVKRQLVSDPFYVNGVREYQDTDSIKQVNWLATAKQQQLMVFTNDYTTSQSIAVILNMQSKDFETNSVYNEEALERCISICATIFFDATDKMIPIRLISNNSLNNDDEPIITNEFFGEEHFEGLLRTLAVMKYSNCEDFSSFLFSTCASVSQTDIIVVTTYLNDAIIKFAQNKKGVKIVTLCNTADENVPNDVDVISLYEHFKDI